MIDVGDDSERRTRDVAPEALPLHSVLSWAGTLVFLPVFATILVVCDVAQRLARCFGQRPQERVAGALQVALVQAFRLCDTRLLVERAPGVRPGASYIVVSNHQSMFDIPIIGALLRSNFRTIFGQRTTTCHRHPRPL